MKLWIGSLLTLASVSIMRSENLSSRYAREGTLLISHFSSAPFPSTNRAAGYRYQDAFYPAKEHYSDDSVGIFIPAKFRVGSSVSLVIHFHGWRNNVTNVLEHYRLIEQFTASDRNAVLVVPQGPRDAPDSSGGKLDELDGFKRFIDELGDVLRQQEPFKQKPFEIGDVILSGHSGGYKVISSILAHGGLTDHVKEVWLFDALYGHTDDFLKWFDAAHGRLIDVYTEHGGTKAETEGLINLLKQRGTPIHSGMETETKSEDLKTNRGIFIYTTLPHDDVVAKQESFRQFLETSCLPSISMEKPERSFKTDR
jgi:hypothetical protein